MLVLSRQRDEEIVVRHGGEEVVVTVVDIRVDKVRLGVTAPACMTVHRKEVQDAIDKEAKEEAARKKAIADRNAAAAEHALVGAEKTK